jgi:spore germination cell wall hydrolase CwlJ-like protein
LTFGEGRGIGQSPAMLWNIAFVGYFFVVVGALVFGFITVQAQRQSAAAQTRDFHVRSLDCLARNVYYEARGESLLGQYAVAEVTMNRKASPFYPKTVCEVVYQREAFSWTDSIDLETPAGPAWKRAQKVADEVYYQRRPPTMSGVLHFHAVYVQPDWSKERRRVARIGRHVFYR